MALPNLGYGLLCAGAFVAGAALADWLGASTRLGPFARRLVAGAAAGIGLGAALAGP